MSIDLNAFTIREAHTSDDDALRRLAELDGGRVPSGRILVGELEGELVAAVPMAGGPAIADSTRSTSALVSLLGLRAAQLRGLDSRQKSRGPTRRIIPAAGTRHPRIPAKRDRPAGGSHWRAPRAAISSRRQTHARGVTGYESQRIG
jgi:hypothetical protein